MRKNYDVVIIGGGIHGLSLAYYLARSGLNRVAVFEKNYLGSGASGRNGEMIRSAFGSEEWIRLWDKSLKLWENLAGELDFNVMFTRHGYLVLATKTDQLDNMRANIKQQHKFGLDTCLLGGGEVTKLVPEINPKMTVGGILQSNAGFARHDGAIWAYARAAHRLKVDIFPFTEVIDILIKSGMIRAVKTSKGDVETKLVVNAAGAQDQRIAEMVGVKLPTQSYRNEIFVTEPIKPFLRIGVSAPSTLCYMHQSTRGEFVGGGEKEDHLPCVSMKNSLETTRSIAAKYVRLFPRLAGVKLMRQWAGIISVTPDRGPMIGSVPEIEGFILSVGWGGYGFMGGPAGGKVLAEFILTGDAPLEMRPFKPGRFKTGELIRESAIIFSSTGNISEN